MVTTIHPWYAGRFKGRRGNRGTVEVLAIETESGWKRIPKPKQLFPKAGEADLPGNKITSFSPGEWLAFQVGTSQKSKGVYRITECRSLPRFVERLDIGSVERAIAMFSGEGWREQSAPGHWAVRVNNDQIIVIKLILDNDGALRISKTAHQNIATHSFEPIGPIPEPGTEGLREFYDLVSTPPALDSYRWSSDADHITRVIKSLAGATDQRLSDIITWLELHTDEAGRTISATGADPEFAKEALRSGQLAARLSADQNIMKAYLAAVSTDESVSKLIQSAANAIAEDERPIIRANLKREITQELLSEKELSQKAFAQELRDVQKNGLETIQAKLSSRLKEIEVELKSRESRGIADLEAKVSRHKTKLESDIEALKKKREQLSDEEKSLDRQREFIKKDLISLTQRRQELSSDIDRMASALTALSSANQGARPIVQQKKNSPMIKRGSTLPIQALATEIDNCKLLSANGKSLLGQFLVLMLAGELPILTGPDVNDFLKIAECLVSSGFSIRLEADPTIISVEDLWLSPGSGKETALMNAVSAADGEQGFTTLAIITNIEQSGGRFWYPALLNQLQQGFLPRRLLICATISDAETKESKAIGLDGCVLKISNVIEPGSSLLAPALLGAGAKSYNFELDPGEWLSDLSAGAGLLLDMNLDTGVFDTLRASRICLEANRVRAPNNNKKVAYEFAKQLVDQVRKKSNK